MPQDVNEVEVLTAWAVEPSPGGGAVPLEFGAHGNAIKLLAVHYTLQNIFSGMPGQISVAISSNPAHDPNPLLGVDYLNEQKSLYGFFRRDWELIIAGEAYGFMSMYSTEIVPLYGLIRPRRQLLVWLFQNLTATINIRADIYYEPVILGKIQLDTLNRRFGKYRRT